jgi:hypothetical protein
MKPECPYDWTTNPEDNRKYRIKVPKKIYTDIGGGKIRFFTGQIMRKSKAGILITRYEKQSFLEHL